MTIDSRHIVEAAVLLEALKLIHGGLRIEVNRIGNLRVSDQADSMVAWICMREGRVEWVSETDEKKWKRS